MADATLAAGKIGPSVDDMLDRAGTGAFQQRLLVIFGLVWAADAMQVLSVGIAAPSIAATFGMTIPEAIQQTGTIFFLGMLVGAAGFGRLADRIGRRRVLLVTVAVDAVAGLMAAVVPDFSALLVLRFITGAAVGGTLPVDYAMMAEFLPKDRRGRWLVILEGFWAVGTVAIAGVAWAAAGLGAAEPWRWILGAAALPALVGIVLRLWVPESPHFLLRTGRSVEAKAVLDRVIAVNGQPALPGRLEAPPMGEGAAGPFSPELRSRTLMVLAVWFLVSISYYGVFSWLPGQLAAKGLSVVRAYGFLVVLALAQLPGYALAAYGVERWGRRPTLVAFLVLSAAACLIFTLASAQPVVLGAMLLMSFALLGTWGALYAFTPELYPTRSRGTGMGAAGAAARLGGLLAPSALAPVVAISFEAAVGLFSALLLVAAVAAMAIGTETRGRALA